MLPRTFIRPPPSLRAALRSATGPATRNSPRPLTTAAAPRRSVLSRVARGVALTTGVGVALGASTLGVALATADPDALARGIRAELPDCDLFRDADARAPFSGKSTAQVAVSMLVFELCRLSWLVDAAPHLLNAADTLGLTALAHAIVKGTFFAHFCGGEDAAELGPVMAALKRHGIGSILDISIEADLEPEPTTDAERAAKAMRDEQASDKHRDLFLQSLDAAAQVPGALIAVKVTALAPTSTLLATSSALARALRATEQRAISRAEWTAAVGPQGEALFDRMDADKDGQVTATDFLHVLTTDMAANDAQLQTTMQALAVPAKHAAGFARLVERMLALCAHAQKKRVGLMVDAEQTYFQDAIDVVALGMGRQFNAATAESETPVVFNTYQMYLKSGNPRLNRDLALSAAQGWHFAVKMVRGAYMNSERAKAAAEGYASPVHETIQDTHASYAAGVATMLNRIESSSEYEKSATLMVASHNRHSVVSTAEAMTRRGIDARSGRVLFGQLLGMHDMTGYALAAKGFPIFKYVPYGPIEEVIPYLLRRAQENNSVLGGAALDRMLLWHELVCRFKRPAPEASAERRTGTTPAQAV
ncbi:hypothetical protein GGF32_007067 [Allomyces javanicus]|nr:hypothetical protein GGF32_007067 [Allomyces javanicus]